VLHVCAYTEAVSMSFGCNQALIRKQFDSDIFKSQPQKNSENEMTTIQGSQRRTAAIQWPPRRYPIALQLHYKATSKLGSFHGAGRIRMMSSKDIIFAPGDGLKPGMKAEIAVAWPRLLDGRMRLDLVLQATITGSQDGVVKARIRAYDFRTAGRACGERRERVSPVCYEFASGLRSSGRPQKP
jgi:hypothetical protein